MRTWTEYLRTGGARQRSSWLLLFGGALLLGTVAVILSVPGSDGFEQSIYSAYPLSFWVALTLTFFVGTLVILREAFAPEPNPRSWMSGFALSLTAASILLLMPLIRGYRVYGRADLLTHIGHTRVIHDTGGGPFQNIYQSLHQLALALSYATGMEPITLYNTIPVVITVFSILASYLLLTTVFDERRALMTLPFVMVLVAGSTHLNPSPYAQSVILLPFVLYLFARTQETDVFSFRLPLALTVIAVVLYHPLTAVFLLVVFLIHYCVLRFSTWRNAPNISTPISRVSATSIVQLVAVTFLAWYYNFVGILIRFDIVLGQLLQPGESETELDMYGETIAEFSPELVDIARVAVFRFGNRFVLLALGSTFVLMAIWRYIQGERFSTPYLSTFALGFIVFSAFGALFLLVDLIGGFGRPLVFAQYFAAFLAGSIILELYNRTERQTALFVGTVAVVLVVATVSIATLYGSGMAAQSTSQVTDQDLASAEWYLDNELQTTPLQESGTTMYRFEHALAGSDSNTVQRDGTFPPERFNYTQHDTLGTSYDIDQYLVITERGKQFYPNSYPGYDDSWRFLPADFDRLTHDPTLSRVYTNDDIEIYRIHASGVGE